MDPPFIEEGKMDVEDQCGMGLTDGRVTIK